MGAREGGTIRRFTSPSERRWRRARYSPAWDASDLQAERRLRAEELASLESIAAADRRRYSVEYDLLRLRLSEQYAAVQAGEAELDALSRELEALVSAKAPAWDTIAS